ncbi:ABC-three component system middle component 5 [Mesorhizobium sp. M0239]|uniref:ABC-three component system middle component 5 n=1 Tax=Mesorhizobium sp. M0239 TaxID=2956924 RepID=UPI00333BCF89
MTQLSFQPAFDAFHTVFRFLRLRAVVEAVGPLPYDKIRILDFYLLFPHKIQDIRLTQKHQKFKKLSEKYFYMKPYGELPDSRMLLERMGPMQVAAAQTLATRSLMSSEALEHEEVRATKAALPPELATRIEQLNESQSDLMEFLSILANDYPLAGDSGLKARTGLMEHRYDAI